MPTYVYQTIPAETGGEPRYYEFRQSMRDDPLATHPETGEPIRRVILGGFGILSSTRGGESRGGARPGDCGPGCCCE